MGFEVWDVVRVPFPYTDRPIRQRRPALVVATPQTQGGADLLWVLMVTSAVNRDWAGDVLVSDLAAAGLPAPSIIRCAKIATLEVGAAEPIGRLPAADRRAVAVGLHDSIGAALTAASRYPSA